MMSVANVPKMKFYQNITSEFFVKIIFIFTPSYLWSCTNKNLTSLKNKIGEVCHKKYGQTPLSEKHACLFIGSLADLMFPQNN